jgi:hypothetical protein
VPIMFDTTRAAQLVTVRRRRSGAVISYRQDARTYLGSKATGSS